ncbi:MAG: oligosaccharide flippase family protein [Methylotenera sp.]
MAATVFLISNINLFFSDSLSITQLATLKEMVLVTGIGAAVLIAFNPIAALLQAMEQFVFLRSLDIFSTILSTFITVILLNHGYGVLMVVSVMTVAIVLQVLLRIIYLSFPLRVSVRYRLPNKAELNRVFKYALPIFVSIIVETVFWKLDNLLIASILGAAPVAIYAIGVTFNKYFMSFATAISRIMTPEIVRQVDSGSNPTDLTKMMIRISRWQALILLPILSGLIVFGQRFLSQWLGSGFELSYYVMLAVICPYALELIGNARNIVLQVKGLYWHKSIISASMAIINIPLTIWFIHMWGVFGAALSTGIAIFIGYVFIAVLLEIRVGIKAQTYLSETMRGVLPVCVILTALGHYLQNFLPLNWFGLILGVAIFCVAYTLMVRFFAINHEELSRLKKVFRFI